MQMQNHGFAPDRFVLLTVQSRLGACVQLDEISQVMPFALGIPDGNTYTQ